MLTFGTGIGTALFTDGKLFPNTELGHLEMRGMDAEKWTSAQVRTAEGLDFPAWIARVNEYLAGMHRLFWPDVFILGGAVSERFDEFAPLLRSSGAVAAGAFRRPGGRGWSGAGRGRARLRSTERRGAASSPTSARRSSRSCRAARASSTR